MAKGGHNYFESSDLTFKAVPLLRYTTLSWGGGGDIAQGGQNYFEKVLSSRFEYYHSEKLR